MCVGVGSAGGCGHPIGTLQTARKEARGYNRFTSVVRGLRRRVGGRALGGNRHLSALLIARSCTLFIYLRHAL